MGVIAPILLGGLVSWLFGYSGIESIFIGIILSATSISISAQTLMELGVIRRRESLALLGAAVIDDVLGILVLSVFTALTGDNAGSQASLATLFPIFLRIGLYLAGATALGWFLVPRLTDWAKGLPVSQGLMSFVIVAALSFAWAAEVWGGIAAITGAFLVGLAFARTPARQEIEHSFAALTYGFFVPLFFVSIGLEANVRAVKPQDWLFAFVLILAAVTSKILGCTLGARWGGLTRKESFRLGLGMISRGEVGLIMASVGLAGGLINQTIFAEIVLVVLVTTVLTPVLLKWAYARESAWPARPAVEP